MYVWMWGRRGVGLHTYVFTYQPVTLELVQTRNLRAKKVIDSSPAAFVLGCPSALQVLHCLPLNHGIDEMCVCVFGGGRAGGAKETKSQREWKALLRGGKAEKVPHPKKY